MTRSSYLTGTDLFCGAGGSTTGAKMVNGIEMVMAVNHWQLAIETHNTNHPETQHVLTDISTADPRRFPSTEFLLASPECTNHSLAKGKMRKNGQCLLPGFGEKEYDPAAERSRATMWDVIRFTEAHRYQFVVVENVVDARKWELFDAWIVAMQAMNYDFEIVYLNSQFAPPTPQSRDRMYVVFWRRGNKKPNLSFRPKAFCQHCDREVAALQTWKKDWPWGRYHDQYEYHCPNCGKVVRPYYHAAWEAIDWSIQPQRIGDRKKPLAENTIRRIRYGLRKYAQQPALVQLAYSHAGDKRAYSVEEPFPTQTTRQDTGLSIPPFLMQFYTRDSAHSPISEPVPTITGDPRHALVVPPFMVEMYGTSTTRPIDEPISTIETVPHHALVMPPFMIQNYGGDQHASGIHEPLRTVTAQDHHSLVVPFTIQFYGTMNASQISEPLPTVTTKDRHALVIPDETVEECGFRMLTPHELKRAMAFPNEYVVLGNNKEQVNQLGNAVTPPAMQMLVERCVASLA